MTTDRNVDPELLPCPFCGQPVGHYFNRIYCHGCFASGPCIDNKEKRIKHWNTRYDRTVK